MKQILIILYKFPPMGGVGSRRWVKFSKYLIKQGYSINVLTSDYRYVDKVSWIKDVDKKVHVYKFKSKYPQWLLAETNNYFLQQVKRYINFILRNLFFYLDIAQLDSRSILSKAKKIIKKKSIKNIIASGPPFSINYFSTYLKIDHPEINLIQDFRDNWNDLIYFHYPQQLVLNSFRRKEKNAYKEFFTLFYADKVVNVSEDLTNISKNKHYCFNNKFFTITNGYDNDDYNGIVSEEKSLDIIYTGSLYNHRIEAIYLIMDAIISLNDQYLNKNLKINIYSEFKSKAIKNQYKKLLGRNIFFKDTITPEKILFKISKSAFCLSTNSKYAPYAFGTKIFEYMALNKKIIHISNGGHLSKILKNNKQMVCDYDIKNMKKCLLELKNNFINHKHNSNNKYDEFSLKKITYKFNDLLI